MKESGNQPPGGGDRSQLKTMYLSAGELYETFGRTMPSIVKVQICKSSENDFLDMTKDNSVLLAKGIQLVRSIENLAKGTSARISVLPTGMFRLQTFFVSAGRVEAALSLNKDGFLVKSFDLRIARHTLDRQIISKIHRRDICAARYFDAFKAA